MLHAAHAGTVKGTHVEHFIDDLFAAGGGRPTVIVLDNASIHHGIDQEARKRWLIDHKELQFYLPADSPELNMIEILWRRLKCRWHRFGNWTKEASDAELTELLRGYGSAFQTNFSRVLATNFTQVVLRDETVVPREFRCVAGWINQLL